MDNALARYSQPCEPSECRRETPLEQLQRQKKQLEEKLVRVNEALQLLEEHPEITKVMESIARAL